MAFSKNQITYLDKTGKSVFHKRLLSGILGIYDTGVGIFNGILGDSLSKTKYWPDSDMAFFHNNRPLVMQAKEILRVHPRPSSRVVIFVHGLCCTEKIWRFSHKPNTDYGVLMQRDLSYTPFYVRYNTGLHISENGKKLSALISSLVEHYPVAIREIVLVGHSKGGLVIRSACHYGTIEALEWSGLVSRILTLGTPHRGSFLEKFANVFSWGCASSGISIGILFAGILNLRSSAIKDLRFGYTRESEWKGANPDALLENRRANDGHLCPAPHYTAAGSLTKNPRHPVTQIFGDVLVRIPSATAVGQSTLGHQSTHSLQSRLFHSTGHLALTRSPKVYWQILHWCQNPTLFA